MIQALIGLTLYMFSEGVTEGLSSSNRTHLWGLEYHIWRFGELIGIGIALEGIFGFWTTLGLLFIGSFLYERMLQLGQGDSFWDAAQTYHIQGIDIPWGLWQDWGRVGIGLVLIGMGVL